jgi:hypothetical protein
MISSGEYRLQTILAALQCGAIIFGTAWIKIATKFYYPSLGFRAELSGFPLLVLNWGILLLLVPLLWVIVTIRREKASTSTWKRTQTIICGTAILALTIFFFMLVANATIAGRAYHPLPLN